MFSAGVGNVRDFNASSFVHPAPFESDYEFLGGNDHSFSLMKENDELRRTLFDLRKSFLETVGSKDNQIQSLNFYLATTNENCEKIIREAEENYINLKLNYDKTKTDMKDREVEIKNLTATIRSLETNVSYYKEEMSQISEKFKGDKMFKEMEVKLNETCKSYETLLNIYENDKVTNNDLKSQNDKFKNELFLSKHDLKAPKLGNLDPNLYPSLSYHFLYFSY
jgi:chromosome segregation ATPase